MESVSTTAKEVDANRLSFEKSPYLLQHAENPVDWYPWGEESFAAARRENKPIFLSIGYSTCHWCHVMAHESFEDPQVAALMNDAFVNIKVDREERPDIDNVYMTVCQMMTKSGGWPLTIIMTPEKKPFFAATYIPKESRFGRLGMLELIPRIKELWHTERVRIIDSADEITAALARISLTKPGEELGTHVLEAAYEQLSANFDSIYGGFGAAPKFPTPHNLMFLLRQYHTTGNLHALQIVERTLQQMRRGGIYDHIGFGFHRYATDRGWLVPHFEKMLYDQALLAMTFTETSQVTRKEEYALTAREILAYVLRDMTSPEGGFYSAEDADSEGAEGKFYLWTVDELHRVLGKDEGELVAGVYNARPQGNFTDEAPGHTSDRNILHLQKPLGEIAAGLGMSEKQLHDRLESVRHKLFAFRQKRIHPHKDDKILADWNGLMIAALAKAAQAFDEPVYAQAAARAADFLLCRLRTPNGRLLHRFRDGEAAVAGNCDDYAFMIWGCIELYESTFAAGYLKSALELNDILLAQFWDGQNGGLYLTANDVEEVLVRQKEIYDGAMPSGNAVAMLNLLRLAKITGRIELNDKADRLARAFSDQVRRMPQAHTFLLLAVDFALGPGSEIILAGNPGASDTQGMLRALRQKFLPRSVVLLREGGVADPIIKLAPFTANHTPINGRATAYVCKSHACKQPTADVERMIELLNVESGRIRRAAG